MSDLFSIISEEFLDSISIKTSLNKSLRKVLVSSLTEDDINLVLEDVERIRDLADIIHLRLSDADASYRIKSRDSVKIKVAKYSNTYTSAMVCFNDLLGIRVYVDDYPNEEDVPSCFKYVDLRRGKKVDDGYRAVHLYYEKDNYHYRIEVQLILKKYRDFYSWMHSYSYKSESIQVMQNLMNKFESGKIVNEEDYRKELEIERSLILLSETFGREY